jgi:biopolymer transport protein ExbD
MQNARRRRTEKPRLAMTPMIDVIFNLLIFFLLTPVLRAFDAITAARFRKICFAVPGTRDERKGRMAS